MQYADYYQQLEYYNTWYYENRDKHFKKTTKYYYDNRSKILYLRKLKYKQSKKHKNKIRLQMSGQKNIQDFFLIYIV